MLVVCLCLHYNTIGGAKFNGAPSIVKFAYCEFQIDDKKWNAKCQHLGLGLVSHGLGLGLMGHVLDSTTAYGS